MQAPPLSSLPPRTSTAFLSTVPLTSLLPPLPRHFSETAIRSLARTSSRTSSPAQSQAMQARSLVGDTPPPSTTSSTTVSRPAHRSPASLRSRVSLFHRDKSPASAHSLHSPPSTTATGQAPLYLLPTAAPVITHPHGMVSLRFPTARDTRRPPPP